MSFIEELARKRRKLLDGIDANEGDINLRIFEDFYPDEAHFIYELLQNAEDAGATEASFQVDNDKCIFIHNGKREFDEDDIKSITGIFNSSKKNNPDKIGKFGVGFKSVFVYTDSPIIYSREHNFKILHLVLPEEIKKYEELGDLTRFEFPFNNPKMPPAQAFSEIKAGLEAISPTTLLFLSNLSCVSWSIHEQRGMVIRNEHSDEHLEVLREDDKGIESSHWLRFAVPVIGLGKQNVAVAYELAFIGDFSSFDNASPLAKQLKIVAAARGQVSVFFPADKEVSGLRFHLHGPFVPELSRASIKNTPENTPLFNQLACLSVTSLYRIRDLGLLTADFLGVLPNSRDTIPEKYCVIRSEIVRGMQENELTPTRIRGHAPAKSLLDAPGAMKDLLSNDDLALLLGRDIASSWVVSAAQKNSPQDHFLTTLDIEWWDVGNLVDLFTCRTVDNEYDGFVDPVIMTWLSSKSDEWHQQLYAVLFRWGDEDDNLSLLDDCEIIRLSTGKYSRACLAYYPSKILAGIDAFPRVAEAILSAGTRTVQIRDAASFLERMGVRTVGEIDEILLILNERYAEESEPPSDDVYTADILKFVDFVEQNPSHAYRFKEAYLFKVDNADFNWAFSFAVYLGSDCKDSYLWAYYAGLPIEKRLKGEFSKWYSENFTEKIVARIRKFAKSVGCVTAFSELAVETTCYANPAWTYLRSVAGERETSPINRDFSITKDVAVLLNSQNFHFSLLVWNTMNDASPRFLIATYQKNNSNGCRRAKSSLVCLLAKIEWVPLKDGSFVSPENASGASIHAEFLLNTALKWLGEVGFGKAQRARLEESVAENHRRAELSKRRAELGFVSDEEFERAQNFARLPQFERELVQRLLEEHREKLSATEEEFPVRPVRNPALRTQRVAEQAIASPPKETETRARSVSVGYDLVKTEAKLYLQEQYTNANGVMFCQVCKSSLPFRLPSGSYYFEAVEVVAGMPKRFRETFLALCPNHSAMFRYALKNEGDMKQLLEGVVGLEVEVTLAAESETILFTETHLTDIKACIGVAENSSESA